MSVPLSRSSSQIGSPTREEQRRKNQQETGGLAPQLSTLYNRLKQAEENFNQMDIRDILIEIGDYFYNSAEYDRSLSNFMIAYSKAATTDVKIDVTLKIMLIGFKLKDLELLKKQVQQAAVHFEQGGDWERKNRYKAYQAGYLMMTRNFKQAALNLLQILATFTSTELYTFNDFVKYTVLMSLVSLDRAAIRQKVVHAPEILSTIRNLPEIHSFLDSLFKCQYREFFQIFLSIYELVKNDEYLAPHIRYWARQMRVVAYSQFLESYRSVTLETMASAFGISSEFLDRELCEFISLGRLPCKIDKVNGVVESSRPDTRSAIYSQMIKTGDVLLNRLQKLARVMDV